ncbi:alpha/beta hydrolase fold protein [Rhodomicrobium vannielii ATCC 17100]|uniref:Alpha/beta hydrolase fold protein n=1 Tax=Rhodomicrobium vannielii (strain ATCC 17100 / DSM 162 / LMG 4299 / NCIMB 10020 / ATH 3.1.1) TaxID=648757 RepID=E3I8K5_RHOVT|nr:alpha/beta hydrolase [Rhodomicrobium vannielii]ADP70914.1 alpha/beta hydrolase fold protein [Rhodomicrobium vannielii ATCC 17100]
MAFATSTRHSNAAVFAGEPRTLALSGGRKLAWSEYGDDAGLPVFVFHGTPGSRLMYRLADAPARRLGLRLISPDRPGFGASDFQPGRKLVDWPGDVAALADRLGIGRFAVAGVSGGGPYAAACAALLPDRVMAAALVSPVGPMCPPEGPANLPRGEAIFFRSMPHYTLAMTGVFSLSRALFKAAPDAMFRGLMRRAGPADAPILSRPEVKANVLAGVIEGIRPGIRGVVQEFRIFSERWDIPFEAIEAPFLLWQGLADRNVPVSAALHLGELVPQCRPVRVVGAGHYWIFDHMEEVLGALKDSITAAS